MSVGSTQANAPRGAAPLAALLLFAACAANQLRGADPLVPVRLPADRAAHADAQTEWWHLHGHLVDEAGHRYDWFFAFIREHTDQDYLAGLPVRWFVNPFHSAYFTVTDRQTGKLHLRDKYSYPDLWAAQAREDRLELRHDEWRVASTPAGDPSYLQAGTARSRLELRLRPAKPPALLGRQGYVSFPGADSSQYWEALSHLESEGTLTLDGREHRVRGLAWYKHEWGFMYSDKVAGWVYLGMQLSSGVELEIALVYDRDWKLIEGSFAQVIERDGRLTPLDLKAVDLRESGETWRSPRNGTVYPLGWTVGLPERQGGLVVRAVAPDQEMVILPANLWGGTLSVTGTFDGVPVTGDCFSELGGFQAPFGRALFRSGQPP